MYGVGSIPTGNPDFRITGWDNRSNSTRAPGGQEAHKIGYVERISSTRAGCVGLLRFLVGSYSKKQFYDSTKGQEAYKKQFYEGPKEQHNT